MSQPGHFQKHHRKRDFIWEVNAEERLKQAAIFDGESCLTATAASLSNAMVVIPQSAKYSDAYKLGMGPEKILNTYADLTKTWEHPGKSEWHDQVGDSWGPILLNLKNGVAG
jgi:hypothetical protein